MRYLILVALSFCFTIGSSQSVETFQQMRKDYPDDRAVYLERSKYLTLLAEGDSLISSAFIKEEVLFLKDQANQQSAWRIYSSYFQEADDIQSKTFVLNKDRYRELKMEKPKKLNENDNSIFYDDSYYYQLSFPDGAGNLATWSYKEKFRDPKFLPSFYFSSTLPIAKTSLTIKASKGIVLSWSVYNDENKKVQFKQYDKGSFTYYEWTAEKVNTFLREDDSPKSSYYIPHVVYYVKTFPTKHGGPKKVLSGIDDLYNSYLETLSKVNEKPSAELEAIVHSLIGPNDKELDKVRKIFYWVQDNVRYIAFEDGMRGLVPHPPSYILDKRYGDCKDMASLIVGMLRIAGVTSYHTWIGTRDLPYRYSVLPSPLVDNHMIATYIDPNHKYYFLDATGNYTTLDLPSSMIQGKEALIALGKSGYEIHEVPEIPAEANMKKDSVWVHIDNTFLAGKGTTYFTGYEKIYASYAFDKAVEESKKDNVVSRLNMGNNKFSLNSYGMINLNEKDAPLKLDYDFKISDYVSSVGDELYLNLNLSKVLNVPVPADRKLPIENDYKVSYEDTYQLTIPEGYSLEYLPPDAALHSKTIDFVIDYTVKGNILTLNSKVSRSPLMLTPDLFADWNDGVRKLNKSYKETIILKKATK